jgi:hypothetical protein
MNIIRIYLRKSVSYFTCALDLSIYSNSSESKIASATWRMDFRESMLRF